MEVAASLAQVAAPVRVAGSGVELKDENKDEEAKLAARLRELTDNA
jgi:hypothetical protein